MLFTLYLTIYLIEQIITYLSLDSSLCLLQLYIYVIEDQSFVTVILELSKFHNFYKFCKFIQFPNAVLMLSTKKFKRAAY